MYELLLRVATTDPDGSRSRPHDVVARVGPDHIVRDLVDALATRTGLPSTAGVMHVERTGVTSSAGTPIEAVDLCSGDTVVLGVPRRRPARPPRRALVLDVVGGPDSGRAFPLRTGATVVGRSRRADVTLTDPSISRHHLTVRVDGGGSVTIVAERGAVNATATAGVTLPPGTSRPLLVDDEVTVGGTELVLRAVDRPVPTRATAGTIEFQRTPYRPGLVESVSVAPIGPIPTRPEPRRLQLIAVLAPLVAGLGMFLLVGQPHFLLFTLISPVVMIGTAIDDRRTGRRSHATRVAELRTMLATRRSEIEQLTEAERLERHRAAPDIADLVRRAADRSVDLWSRGRTAPDVLHLRLGRGDGTALVTAELERGGDPDLRDEAAAAVAGADRLASVPITVDLVRDVLAVHGEHEPATELAASLVVQAATLHSPVDLTIVAAVSPERGLGWMKWLPHVRSATSPVPGRHLATEARSADELVESLLEVAAFRVDDRPGPRRSWPAVLAVIDAAVGADPAAVARLLDVARAAAIAVVWLADDVAAVPRHADLVLCVGAAPGGRAHGRLWSTDPGVEDRQIDVERLRADVADRAARSLAPIRDASTSSRTAEIPRTAPLLDVVGADAGEPSAIVERWELRRRSTELPFTIGLDAGGALELDLVGDGPHALIGGTSGAGKSELLQSMVASLAANHSPRRLNLLFVDYKGGASSQVFERLPHTVGYVTNLSADLALRALTSLRAELQRRMALLEGRAKDVTELRERHPGDAPASLVIVVDEFATLVKEVPDFVAGVVDIAQRGRSLGIHLVLATQRPTGAVDENILANTNLRISLRMLDRGESTSIIGCPDAADIPVPLRGRGLVRRGPGRIVEFQSAFAGAPRRADVRDASVVITPFDHPQARPSAPGSDLPDGDGTTHLDVVLDAIVAANAGLGLPAPRRPWCDVLPDVVALDDVLSDPRAVAARRACGCPVAIGLLDAPERQEQHAAIVDLEATGGLAVVGAGGSGKTTLLRSLALAADRAAVDGADTVTVVFDGAGRGLAGLGELGSVIAVASGDDLEAVTRQLLVLDAELERRRDRLAGSGADSLSAHRSAGHDDLPRVLVLVDGFDSLAALLFDLGGPLGSGGEPWADRFQRLVVDGRRVGIHTVIAATRRAAIPARLHSAIGARVVLRHADPQSYAEFGIRPDRAAALDATPGRAILDGVTVQLAVVAADPTTRGQIAAIAEHARRASVRRRHDHGLAGVALPDELDPNCLPAATGPGSVVIGLTDGVGAPATIDIAWSNVAVVGPPRSGRSTALAAVVAGLHPDEHTVVVGPASSPLARLVEHVPHVHDHAFGEPGKVGAVLDRVANLAALSPTGERIVVVVDDLDVFDDPVMASVFDRLLARDRVRLVAAVDTRAMTGYSAVPAIAELRRARRLLILRPDDPNEFLQIGGVKLATRPGLRWVAGRGVLLVDRVPTVVQVANVSTETAVIAAA